MQRYETVLFEIEVPYGEYCWKNMTDGSPICTYFDNDYNEAHCQFEFGPIIHDGKNGFLKPCECRKLRKLKYIMKG
jgi:hypothetical protein